MGCRWGVGEAPGALVRRRGEGGCWWVTWYIFRALVGVGGALDAFLGHRWCINGTSVRHLVHFWGVSNVLVGHLVHF